MTILTYYEYLLKEKLEHSKDSYRLYRRCYQRLYQRQRRQDFKEVSLLLTHDDHTRLKAGAINHSRSLSKFITSASLCYLDKRYLVPDETRQEHILQALALTYTQIQYLADQVSKEDTHILLKHIFTLITKLEAKIESLLTHPFTLEEVITKTLNSHPAFYTKLTNLLKTYDCQS